MSEYKRLTNKDWKENYDIFEDVCCDTCAEDCGECERNFNALVRLAELEDKIEAGTLIEIPCIRKLNIAAIDCVEVVYIQHNGTIGECVCLNEAEAKKTLEKMKNEI